jgi:DNA-binding PadR family transcriptional regulator
MSEESEYPELIQRIVRSFLDIIVLRMLTEESMWGYRIMTLLRERYNVMVGPPVIYPLLDRMGRDGLVSSHQEKQANRVRKIYTVTEKGQDYLNGMRKIADEILG